MVPGPGAVTRTVILVHGLWLNRHAMWPLGRVLRARGWQVRDFEYDGRSEDLDSHARRLARGLREVACAEGRAHALGHSLGGLVVLRALELAGVQAGRAVLLGSPLRGSSAALEFARQGFGRWMLGASLDLWRSGPRVRVPAGIEAGVIAGDHAFGLGPLFVTLTEPSDGVVTLAETRIEGLADHLVLPVSHTGMLLSAEVARQAAGFLDHGRFDR